MATKAGQPALAGLSDDRHRDLGLRHQALLDLVRSILKDTLPARAKVWVFRSRITDAAKPYSDLDLAVDAGRRLTFAEGSAVATAFEESALPWKVDVVDLLSVSDEFRKKIEAQRVRL